MKKLVVLLGLFPLLLLAGNIDIIKNGKPCAVIVVDKKAPRMVQYAAKELQNYIKKRSGRDCIQFYKTQAEKNFFFFCASACARNKLVLYLSERAFEFYEKTHYNQRNS